MRVLFQGDSITDGNRYKDEESRWDLNHQIGHGWQFVIAAELGVRSPHKYEFFNRAVSGNACVELDARWEEDTIALRPDILMLLIGVNDANRNDNGLHDLSASDYRKGLEALILRTKEALPGIRIILLEPFGFQKNGDIPKILEAEQGIVRELAAKYSLELVELQERFNSAASDGDSRYWIWDDIHPTEAGHGLIARAVLDAITDL